MAEISLSTFRFDGYTIEESTYHRNPAFQPHEIPIDFVVEGGIKVYPENVRSEITLSARLFMEETTSEEHTPFTLHLVLKGFFSGESEEMEVAHFIELCKHNAPAILFPFLRSTVADITRSFAQNALVLPLINLQNMEFEDQKEA